MMTPCSYNHKSCFDLSNLNYTYLYYYYRQRHPLLRLCLNYYDDFYHYSDNCHHYNYNRLLTACDFQLKCEVQLNTHHMNHTTTTITAIGFANTQMVTYMDYFYLPLLCCIPSRRRQRRRRQRQRRRRLLLLLVRLVRLRLTRPMTTTTTADDYTYYYNVYDIYNDDHH